MQAMPLKMTQGLYLLREMQDLINHPSLCHHQMVRIMRLSQQRRHHPRHLRQTHRLSGQRREAQPGRCRSDLRVLKEWLEQAGSKAQEKELNVEMPRQPFGRPGISKTIVFASSL
jgi:hypothetical protein